MPSYNKVILMGNLTKDPELRYTPNGAAVLDFNIAINRSWRDQASGEMKEEVTFIGCTAFGKTAETIGQHLRKGNPIHVDGRLKQETWEKDGKPQSKTKVVVESFQFIGSRQSGSEGGEQRAPARQPSARPAPAPKPQEAAPADDGADSDLPF